MKKTLVALAALAATGAFAQAQSGVTLYGALDASLINATKIDTTGTKNVTALSGGALVSPVWGIRGSEDLGGGLSGIFNAEGDIEMTNGNTNSNGLFRRKAFAGLSSSSMGTIKLGLEINPLIDLNGQLMPVSGNSVSTVTSTAFGYADFFTKNAVTYHTPTLFGGLVGTIQKGMSNTVDETAAGSTTNWGLKYNAGPLTIIAAGQDRKSSTGTQSSAAQTGATNKTASILGASYAFGPLTLAAAKINSTIGTSGKQSGMTNLSNQITINAGDYSGTQLGLGYQMSAQTLLGASHTRASGGATLTNMQARYDFSKRTTGYAMYGLADNSTAAAGGILFAPFAPGTSQTTVNITDTSGKGIQGVAGVKQSAIGLGMIHRF
jgi:general bacterial porin, GBP family